MSALKIGDYVIIEDNGWKSTYGRIGRIESFHMPSFGVYNAKVKYLNEEPYTEDGEPRAILSALVNITYLRQISEEEAFIAKLSDK